MSKDQHWYCCYGIILEYGANYSAAIDMYKYAIQMDERSWRALDGLANCLFKQRELDKARDVLYRGIAAIPSTMSWKKVDLQCALIDIVFSKKQYDEATNLAADIYQSEPQNPRVIGVYIKCLFAKNDYSTIGDVVNRYVTSVWRLNNLRGVQHEVAIALRKTERTEMVKPLIYLGCLDAKTLKVKPWLAAHIAEFQYFFCNDLSVSMAHFEEILRPVFRTRLGPELQWAYNYPSNSAHRFLTKIYFQQAVGAHRSGGDASEWITNLQGFVESGVTVMQRLSQPSLLIGYYLREFAKAENDHWRPYFKDVIGLLAELEQSEKKARSNALYELSYALFLAGDEYNALAALASTNMAWEYEEGSAERNAFREFGLHSSFVCDGFCSTTFNRYNTGPYKEFHFCQVCYEVAFCEACYPLLKRGEMHHGICFPDHPHVQTWPVPESARGVAVEFREESGVKIRSEWIEKLREQWS